MTLIEVLKKAKDGQTIHRKYHVSGAGTFTKSCQALVNGSRRALDIKWGGKVLLEDLEADNWELNS